MARSRLIWTAVRRVGEASVGRVKRHARRLCELAKPEWEDTHLLSDRDDPSRDARMAVRRYPWR